MAKVKWVQIRNTIASIVALILVVLLFGFGSVVFGWNIPYLTEFMEGIVGQQ